MKDLPRDGILAAVVFFIGCIAVPIGPAAAQPTVVQTGTGTNTCRLILNFPAGEKVIFHHRWDGASLNAKTLLESVVASTGGELVVSTNDYSTPFSFVPMTNPLSSGLVVHYQGSYEVPYINAIRWNGPGGPQGAEYLYPDNWWHLWVQGPAHVDQSLAFPLPLPPVDLADTSAWFFGENSGLADLTLSNGASVGLVYGTTNQPSLPAPVFLSAVFTSANQLQIRFSTIPGVQYQLETRADLSFGSWSSTGDLIVATATNTLVTIPAENSSGRGFYRLGLLP